MFAFDLAIYHNASFFEQIEHGLYLNINHTGWLADVSQDQKIILIGQRLEIIHRLDKSLCATKLISTILRECIFLKFKVIL